MKRATRVQLWIAVLAAALLLSCTKRVLPPTEPTLGELRSQAPSSQDPEIAARWLLAELFASGGDARRATEARARVDRLGGDGMLAHLARGIDDELHGRLRTAPVHYLGAVASARGSSDPRAPLVAWMAAHQAVAMRDQAPGLWKSSKRFVVQAMREPVNMGWRARGELVDWWVREEYDQATRKVEELAAAQFGCVDQVRLAGPFGREAERDAVRHFPAEAPGPWPVRWKPEPGIGEVPHVLDTDRHGCSVFADEPVGKGIFYAETFVELPESREVLVAVQGALAMWVDDQLVLNRDPRRWGVWPSFGVQLWLGPGRHRLLARLAEPRTSMRVMHPDGRPAKVTSSRDAAPPYSILVPAVTRDPNLLGRFISKGDVVDPQDDITRVVAAYLAFVEDEGDVASVMLEPLVADADQATGPTLTLAARFANSDPIFEESQARDLVRELHERAARKDPGLWRPRLAQALWEGERGGPAAAVKRLRLLVDEFPEVPAVPLALSRLYGQLGWRAEYSSTVKLLAERFPRTTEALMAAVEVHDAQGETARADELVERVRQLDPDSEIALTRALAREDYEAALSELKRLGERRPDRKDIAERIHDVMVRAGNGAETWKKLEAAVEKNPRDGQARLALADAHYAGGKHDALRKALVDAVESGASPTELEAALDLVEGMTELEPYRLQAKPVIAAYEQSGRHLPGTAARVLDYAAVWIKSDGSSRMLEHEIVRIQSAEAISQMAEHRRMTGLVLHMRVIKQDGRILEPEFVPGKPTVTFPHLEVGDYIETENIISTAGDGQHGAHYLGPHWFFREKNVAYARSEFVVISPQSKPLTIEVRGDVPEPVREDTGAFAVRRWRVDASPAAPVEPGSAPITEFLPSVRLGWGIDLPEHLRRLSDSVASLTPVDPRITRIAKRIVEPLPPQQTKERVKRLYRWVMANVEDGKETDGRRVIIGKSGSRARAFEMLCRSMSIPIDFVVARNRLAPPPAGPIEHASQFGALLLRIPDESGPLWLTVGNKYAPFGYVPAEARDVPAYVLTGNEPQKVRTPAGGELDSIVYEGKAELAADGSAKLELVQRFFGRHAVGARQDLAKLPESRLPDVLQSLVGRALSGARLLRHTVEQLDELDSPLSIRMSIEVPNFAHAVGGSLVITPPFVWRVGTLATLPSRQTPLLVSSATHQKTHLSIQLPPGAKLASTLAKGKLANGDRYVRVEDSLKGQVLVLERVVHFPAGRVQPNEYPDFVQFARQADDAQARSIRLTAPR